MTLRSPRRGCIRFLLCWTHGREPMPLGGRGSPRHGDCDERLRDILTRRAGRWLALVGKRDPQSDLASSKPHTRGVRVRVLELHLETFVGQNAV
jgi:hypothetical protein